MKKVYLCFVFLLLLAACQEEKVDPNSPPDLEPVSVQEKALVNASNDFAFKLTKSVNASESSNFFISPLSVGYALGMTFNGAAGSTKEGIKETLDFGDLSDAEINESFRNLTETLTNMDKKALLEIANSIWYREELTVKAAFSGIVEDQYDARISELDFANPKAAGVVNGWIEEKTRDKIKNMIDAIPAEAVMYLVNAIYFKADWTYQFDKNATKKEPFYLENGEAVQTDMMFSEGATIASASREDYQYLEIPYGNKQYSMCVLLPQNDNTVDDIFELIDAQLARELAEESDTATVRLKLPKFQLKYKILLNEYLAAMGMEEAFTGQADFSGLFDEYNDRGELCISRVLHQSFIEVNEEGSEAAAATVVGVVLTSNTEPSPSTVVIDRPFIFFIKEKHTNTILFIGKMMNPSV